MLEFYVLYSKTTGFIDSCGVIDREKEAKMDKDDPSTMSKGVEYAMAKNADLDLVYMPFKRIPMEWIDENKVVNGKIVPMTAQDTADKLAMKPKSEVELLKERIAVLEAKPIAVG
jgi:hypothetical protein